ncbi:hypothetical protein TA3x_000464 [Tundrisphaera sp. TA3]|uniref:hypothetical protein n=1 Tax=Tundrisphaera sp. TA3 TaxID=3435775 RepID=UPI003EBD9A1A
MADTKISSLTVTNSLTGAELVPMVKDGVTVASTTAQIATLAPDSGVTPGSYTNANITVNDKGQVTAAASGTGGGGGGITALTGDVSGSGTGSVSVTVTKINGQTPAAVSISGSYNDLNNKPTLAAVATTGAYADLSGKPVLATVANSGQYADLSGKPTLGTAAALAAGSANGVATLDGSGKIPNSQIPSSLLDGLHYAGLWNANSNTPALSSGAGTANTMYKVSVAGTTALDGISQWDAGDYALYDGTAWGKVDGPGSEVTSVAGRTGNVTLTVADITGTLPVTKGGTGKATLGSGKIIAGNGTSAVAELTAGDNLAVTSTTINTVNRPKRLQIVGTKGGIPNSARTGTTGGRSDTRIESRMKIFNNNPSVSIASLRVGVFGYTMIPAAAPAALAADMTAEAALELVSPSIVKSFYFGSSRIGNVPSGIPLMLSDPHVFELPPATSANVASGANAAFLRAGFTVASSASNLPTDANTQASTDNAVVSANSASQVLATGALGLGSTPGINVIPPKLLMLGIPSSAVPAFLIFGDSIATETADTYNATGDIAYIARAISSAGYYYAKETVGSDRYSFSLQTTGPEKVALVQYATDIIDEMGVNDYANGASITSLKTWSLELWGRWKRISGPYGKPPRIHKCSLTEITSSSNSYVDPAGQTIPYGAGNARQLYNTWVASIAGQKIDPVTGNLDPTNGVVLLDGFIDVRPAFEDPLNPGKWVTNGTANYATNDGIHPKPALHAAAAAIVLAYIQANITGV